MNEAGTFDHGRLKALFAKLVSRAGRQDAAAARLNISRQRVSQLCSANPEHARDIPTWDQVWTLEEACGQSIVFGALAQSIEPTAPARSTDPIRETHEAVQAAAALLPLVLALRTGCPKARQAFETAVDHLIHEATDLQSIADSNVTSIKRGA